MSRVQTFTVIFVVWIVLAVSHYAAVATLEPLRDINDQEDLSEFNGAEVQDGIYEFLTKWMQLMAGAGILAWGFVREYQRQRVGRIVGP